MTAADEYYSIVACPEDLKAANFQSLKFIPDYTGPRVATSRGGAMLSRRPPECRTYRSSSHFAAVMLAPSRAFASFGASEVQSLNAHAGTILVNPAGQECQAHWLSVREATIVTIAPESLLEIAAQELDLGRFELQSPPPGTVDLQALRIAEALAAELADPDTANELYFDSLITIFGVHLLRNYTDRRNSRPAMKGGLPARAAGRVQEYMAANLAQKLSVAELARHCDLSPSHFIRSFTNTFGEGPHRFLIKLRLDEATRLLRETDLSFSQVAYSSGFSSQSHLISTMRKYRGTTPARIRKQSPVPARVISFNTATDEQFAVAE